LLTTPSHPGRVYIHTLLRDGGSLHDWTGGAAGRPGLVLMHGATMDHRRDEEGESWFEGEARLSSLAPLRDDTLSVWLATIARSSWPGCWPLRPTTAHAVRTTRSWSRRSRQG